MFQGNSWEYEGWLLVASNSNKPETLEESNGAKAFADSALRRYVPCRSREGLACKVPARSGNSGREPLALKRQVIYQTRNNIHFNLGTIPVAAMNVNSSILQSILRTCFSTGTWECVEHRTTNFQASYPTRVRSSYPNLITVFRRLICISTASSS